jgi:acyl-coenzyme A thioesterase PaaI-like protein
MTFFERVVSVVGERTMLHALRFYPPYLGAGVRVREAAADLSAIEVEMKLHPWNQNYVGTHFGGSLYAMCDPFFMLMVLNKMGPGYTVWDKSASIDFLKPGRGTVRARMEVPAERIEQIRAEVGASGKSHPHFEVDIRNAEGDVVARVKKVLSVRPKPYSVSESPPSSRPSFSTR